MSPSPANNPFAVLRAFARSRPPAERCELCSKEISADHPHLLEPANRRLLCSCNACALLFPGQPAGRFRRVPRGVRALPDFRMTDAQWEDLHIPINLAFFAYHTPAERVVATYPSPAGATESLLTLETWGRLTEENPVLAALEPDVESLLVNRLGPAREYYRTPIDECFRLVGLIRRHWRGLSGGTEVWREIDRFFVDLKQQAGLAGGAAHA